MWLPTQGVADLRLVNIQRPGSPSAFEIFLILPVYKKDSLRYQFCNKIKVESKRSCCLQMRAREVCIRLHTKVILY